MLIDEFLPVYDFTEYHRVDVDAPIETVYRVVRTLDLRDTYFVRTLFWLRSIPARLQGRQPLGLTLDDLQDMGLILLGKRRLTSSRWDSLANCGRLPGTSRG